MIAQASGEVMEWAGKRRAQSDEDKKSLGKNVTEPKAEVDSMNYQADTQFCLVSQLSCWVCIRLKLLIKLSILMFLMIF